MHKALSWVFVSLFKGSICLRTEYFLAWFRPARHLKLNNVDLSFREVLQEIKTKQNKTTRKQKSQECNRQHEQSVKMRGRPRTALSLSRGWSRQEQKYQAPPHHFGISVIQTISLFPQSAMPPSHFLGASKGWEAGQKRKKNQGLKLCIICH